MRAGLLNEIISLYRPTITKNKFGEDVEELIFNVMTRAQVIHNGGSRTQQSDEITYPYMKLFIVRYYVDVLENDVIEHQHKRYRIQSIDKSRDLQSITITAELINE